MAITTVSGVNTGLQVPVPFFKVPSSGATGATHWLSYWPFGNWPVAGSEDTTLNGVALSSPVTGQIPWTDPNAGNGYLARLQLATPGTSATAAAGQTIILADRLWHNGGIDGTITTAQNIVSPTWPARDIAGATSGDGVLLGVEIGTSLGLSGIPTITIGYTNSSGTSSRTATNIEPTDSAAVKGSFYRIGLQAGDTGVQSVQSITLSANWNGGTGTLNIVAYREIVRTISPALGASYAIDALSGGLAQMYNGSVPFFIGSAPYQNSFQAIHGILQYAWG